MEANEQHKDQFTQKLIKEAGLESPSAQFVDQVMNRIQQATAKEKVYRPLISRAGWWTVGLTIAASILLLYIFPVELSNYTNAIDWSKVPQLNLSLSGFEVSKPLLYGIGFLALFLIQIPLLKRQLNI